MICQEKFHIQEKNPGCLFYNLHNMGHVPLLKMSVDLIFASHHLIAFKDLRNIKALPQKYNTIKSVLVKKLI